MSRRPTGISLLALAYLLLGLFSLVWSGLIFGISGLTALMGGLFGQEAIRAMGGSTVWPAFLGVISAIIQIVTAFGLFGMKKWAWVLALFSAGLTLVQAVVGLFSGGVFAFICGLIWLIVPGAIFFYLLSPGVRAAFGREKQPPAVQTPPSQARPLPPELPLPEQPPAEKPVDPTTLPPEMDSEDPLGNWPPPKNPEV